ncbi:IclR family transcriptional regulator [Celeribacter indicus]|uniref:Transcriptional repressor n=1 Tax=Celeribacter indicus TaxID=1208324 RepID=A0A0B5DMM9_9RHOB|nr:IclR family transcriptional regulator [Celeribacter indicus]AJE44898.1 transcriptional repressor [Celeribacter indicus]SDW97748.1 transcriptional regulator, IclR family [Celeribacter indicus]
MTEEAGQGLKSLDTALGVLAFMARCDGPMTLTDIARSCAMPPSKLHRYLSSFVSAGLVKQEGRSGRYDLGPEAMQLGLASIARHDFVNTTADGLPELTLQTGMTALLAVWANDEAIVVRWQRGISPTVTSIGLGSSMPLLTSATGRVFLAYGSDIATRKARDRELRRAARKPSLLPDIPATGAGLDSLRDRIRDEGYARVDGDFIPGLVAAAAPIIDWQGEAQAVVTLVGVAPETVRPDAPEIATLLNFCRTCSVVRAPSAATGSSRRVRVAT